MHHSFAVAAGEERVVLAVDDRHQVPEVAAAARRLETKGGRTHRDTPGLQPSDLYMSFCFPFLIQLINVKEMKMYKKHTAQF